jgi:hypothetical protein
MPTHARRWVVVAVMLAILAAATPAKIGSPWVWNTSAAPSQSIALPLVHTEVTLAGVFDCVETEFGLGWGTEVITLTDGGGSIYQYVPRTDLISGTWTYTPTTQTIELRNFRWLTATVNFPNSFHSRQYIASGDFDVAIYCSRRIGALLTQ